MSVFAEVLRRLRAAVIVDSRGRGSDVATIKKRDLADLLQDYDRIDSAYRELYSKQAQIPKWRPIAGWLPPLDTPVWLYEPSGRGAFVGERSSSTDGWLWAECNAYRLSDEGNWESVDAYFDDFEPTLWMPLPPAPEKPKQEQQP